MANTRISTNQLDEKLYVSITGLRLKNPFLLLAFLFYAIPSMSQAKKAEGNLLAEARKINGIYHTLSIWKSKETMKNFLYSGAHKKAIISFPKLATGKTYGYSSSTIPSWDEVHGLWLSHAIDYQSK